MKTLIILATLILTQSVFATSVTLKFTQTKNKSGKIAYAIFNSDRGFPEKGAFKTGLVPVSKGQTSVAVTVELPEGEYAVSFYLDENGNKKLDTNVLGIPTERFGFSNDPRIMFGPPSFHACEVNVGAEAVVHSMKLISLL